MNNSKRFEKLDKTQGKLFKFEIIGVEEKS